MGLMGLFISGSCFVFGSSWWAFCYMAWGLEGFVLLGSLMFVDCFLCGCLDHKGYGMLIFYFIVLVYLVYVFVL